jgi:hypothetical protein
MATTRQEGEITRGDLTQQVAASRGTPTAPTIRCRHHLTARAEESGGIEWSFRRRRGLEI